MPNRGRAGKESGDENASDFYFKRANFSSETGGEMWGILCQSGSDLCENPPRRSERKQERKSSEGAVDDGRKMIEKRRSEGVRFPLKREVEAGMKLPPERRAEAARFARTDGENAPPQKCRTGGERGRDGVTKTLPIFTSKRGNFPSETGGEMRGNFMPKRKRSL